MAQPLYAIDYLGAIKVTAGVQYLSADILTSFPSATVMKLKPLLASLISKTSVSVGINGGIMFPVAYDDESYITTGRTFIFDTDCIIAVGIYKVVV